MSATTADSAPDLGPRAVTYPYRRIERPRPTPAAGPDPYGEPVPAWLEIDWSEHLRWAEIDGTAVNYAEIGSGEPILFIHGLGGRWQNWLANLPHFAAAGYRAIALDLPGFGASPMPEWELTIPNYGGLLRDFCAELGLRGTTMVGSSMGGFIAAEVELSVPEWNDRLVLVSAAGISHAEMRREPVMAGATAMAALNPLALTLNRAALQRPGLRGLAFGGVLRHPDQLRRELLWELFVPALDAAGWLPAVRELTGYDFLDRLEAIADPTLIVWGRDDLVVPAADAPGYADRLTDSELVIFDDCGHLPMCERPVRFNRLVEAFIDRHR